MSDTHTVTFSLI